MTRMNGVLIVLILLGCAHAELSPQHPLEGQPAEQPVVASASLSMVTEFSDQGYWCALVYCTDTEPLCQQMRKKLREDSICLYQDHAWCFDQDGRPTCFTVKPYCERGRKHHKEVFPDAKIGECELHH